MVTNKTEISKAKFTNDDKNLIKFGKDLKYSEKDILTDIGTDYKMFEDEPNTIRMYQNHNQTR